MRGTVIKRGGKWSVVLDLGVELVDGRRRRKRQWHSGYRTWKEADQARIKLLAALDQGTYVAPSKLTVAEYLERWLVEAAKPRVAGTTYDRYVDLVRGHLIPALGTLPLAKLTPLHVQEAYRRLQESGGRRKAAKPKPAKGCGLSDLVGADSVPTRPRGVSAMTALHVHRVLHRALHQAVRWQLAARNVCDAVEPPRPARVEQRALDEVQTSALLEAAKGTPLELAVTLAVTTGLRRGELFGLKWEDLDLAAGTLTVRRAVERTKAKALALKDPKTTKSRRTIALLALAVSSLVAHRKRQAAEKLLLGPGYADQGFIFADPTGQLLDPERATKGIARLCTKAKIPRIRWHDLRHSHASMLLKAGVSVRVVADRLGHSTTRLTMETYAHVLSGMDQDAAARLEAALRGAAGEPRR